MERTAADLKNMSEITSSRPVLPFAKAFAVRAFGLALLWWILSEGQLHDEWTLPVLTVVVAAGSSLLLWEPGAWRWRLIGFLRFVPYFLGQSFLGGVDVARRAMQPSMPLRPGLVEARLRIEHTPARVCLAWIISLLPGTVVANLSGRQITIHSLDTENIPVEDKLRELEEQISEMFKGASR
jgi:multicomponent Na+:H+ antiporter subunit E